MTDVKSRTEDWKTLPWKHIQRNVFRLQQRIYQAVYCSTLQCRTSWRLKASPQLTTTAALQLVGSMSGGTTSHTGQPRQAYTRCGRCSKSDTQTTDGAGRRTEGCVALAGRLDTENLYRKTREHRATWSRNSHYARKGNASIGAGGAEVVNHPELLAVDECSLSSPWASRQPTPESPTRTSLAVV